MTFRKKPMPNVGPLGVIVDGFDKNLEPPKEPRQPLRIKPEPAERPPKPKRNPFR